MTWSAADVAALRARFGLAPGAFADLLGVDTRTVHRWETGIAHPSGTAEAVLAGLREALRGRDPGDAEAVVCFVVEASAVGGLSYLLVKLLGYVGR